MRRLAATLSLLSAVLILQGCKKQFACDPTDSDAVCKGFKQCLQSDTSPEVCQMAEKDANKVEKGNKH
jgi:uncharacterized protein YgiB involved in biofilm formation